MSKKLTVDNAIGLAKYIHGMCVDELPHGMVREKVRELIKMLHKLRGRGTGGA